MEKHFTSTVFIIHDDRVLLLYHQKLQKWLPPGGHMEANETPPEAARREVLEETGLEIEFVQQENIWVERWNASSFERPYLCLLENIPEHKSTPAHQHIDLVYVARPKHPMSIPLDGCRWFSLEDLGSLKSDIDIFEETMQIIRHILKSFNNENASDGHLWTAMDNNSMDEDRHP